MQDATILQVMGWLRDLMDLSDPPIPSFGRLAAACLEHSEWPTEAGLKTRSLATLFSKLDREQDLDWLRDRPDVQLVLARVLGRPLGDLQASLGEGDLPLKGRHLRLHAARFARELDLAREPLPPGIPLAAFTPPLWEPSLWVAPAGSGKTLVGQWLRARGLAQFVTLRSAEDIERLPARGALFVELSARLALGAGEVTRWGGDRRPLCIATDRPLEAPGFRLIRSEAPATYLAELVDWLAARLDDSGKFEAGRAEQWMRRVALPHGAAQTFGDALGLLGLLDETTPRTVTGRGLDELAEAFVKRRVREATLETTWGPRVAESAYDILRRVAAKCLVTSGARLDLPRSLAEWTELLADPDEVAPDEEWFTRALLGESSLSQRELRRAAKRLPPSGYQVARSLSLAGLLQKPFEETDDDLSVLSPRFLVSVLEARAFDDALSLSPVDWGTALLDRERQPAIERALRQRLFAGNSDAVELLLEDFDQASPALMAATDAAVRAAADAQLEGHGLPEELLLSLLELVAENLIAWDEELRPSLTLGPVSAWRAALCALSRDHGFPIASLDPHRAAGGVLRQRFAQACARQAVDSGKLGYLALADELTPRGASGRHQLLLAVDAICERKVTEASAHLTLLEEQGTLIFRYVLERCGRSATANLFAFLPPNDPGRRMLGEELERQLWIHCPNEVLVGRHQRAEAIAWEALLPHHFGVLFASGVPLPEPAARICPLDALVEAVQNWGPRALTEEGLRAALERAPRDLARPVALWLPQLPEDLADRVVEKMPAPAASALVRVLPPTEEILTWPPERVRFVQRFLSDCVLNRVPDLEHCFLRQEELRRALRPLLR